MYKRQFDKWGWRKNRSVKNYANHDCVSSIQDSYAGKPVQMMRSSTIREKASIKTSPCSRTVAVVSGLGQPTMIGKTNSMKTRGEFSSMLGSSILVR
jgi:hypothetical protein